MPTIDQNDIALPVHNWEAFHQLQQERKYYSAAYIWLTDAAISELMRSPNSAKYLLPALTSRPLDRIQKLTQLTLLMHLLLKEFEPWGVRVFPRLEVPGQKHPLDLLVQFPKKAHILVSIRCKGESQIIYNEAKEALYVRRKKKGIKVWEPCPLVQLSDYTHWLNKNRQIFEISSKEVRNVPLAKVLVLYKPTVVGDHREQLCTTIESLKLLILKKKGVAFVITEKNLVNFIKAYLASYEAKET